MGDRSENKSTERPTGIERERGHGPGEVHVVWMNAGQEVDTSKYIDYSIVHPGRLSPKLQFDICARCHLQGTMVLKPGKSFYDFRPGMELTTVMDIFMPRFEGGKEDFIMASHTERLAESRCIIESRGELGCIGCHIAHISYKDMVSEQFNNFCASCHKPGTIECSELLETREAVVNNCVTCHMPESKTRDIPHVTIHDHKIAIPPTEEMLNSPRVFKGLVAVNNPDTDSLTIAKGYLLEYEAYASSPQYLDTAYRYLQPVNAANDPEKFNTVINYYFLHGDLDSILSYVRAIGFKKVIDDYLNEQSFNNYDAWTAYRIGQGYESTGNLQLAIRWYEKAVSLARYVLEFQVKYGTALTMSGDPAKAQSVFEFVIREDPKFVSARVNLGYVLMTGGFINEANQQYDIALALDPDHVQALLNKAGIMFLNEENRQGEALIRRVLEVDPGNEQARMILNGLPGH